MENATDICNCCLKTQYILHEEALEDFAEESDGDIVLTKFIDILKFCFPDININFKEAFKLCDNCYHLLKATYLLKQQLLKTNYLTVEQLLLDEDELNEGNINKNDDSIKYTHLEEEEENNKISEDVVEDLQVRTSKRLCKKANINAPENPIEETELFDIISFNADDTDIEDANDHSYSKKNSNNLEDVQFGCGYCGDAFNVKTALIVHLKAHIKETNETLYKCDHCSESFSQEDERVTHLQTDHADLQQSSSEQDDRSTKRRKAKRHACRYCSKRYVIRSACKSHEQSHFAEPTTYQCEHCPKAFKNSKNLQDHVRVHTGEKPFLCNLCGRCFRQQQHLTVHEHWHRGDRPFKCDHCPKTFRFYRGLMEHESRNAGPNRPYACQYCDAAFSLKKSLNRHELDHQKPAKAVVWHECQYCDKKFSKVGTLNIHERLHTGVKPYQCGHCSKTFSDASYLRYHRLMHANEKPYRCDSCDRSYRSSGALIIHKRIHSGEKPYTCQYCPMAFRSKPVRLKHEQKVHEMKRFVIESHDA